MNTTRFYGHFVAAYGSCWLLLFLAALVTQSHINLGELGFYGFPAISLVYAYLRYKGNPKLDNAILETGLMASQVKFPIFFPNRLNKYYTETIEYYVWSEHG